jgi:hypothetical protein
MENIRLCVVPTIRNVFSREYALKYKKLILEKLNTYDEIEVINIDWLNNEGLLYDSEDGSDTVIKYMVSNLQLGAFKR